MELVRSVLADPDWLLPIAAAQAQYRANYVGMTAAALLEDVWVDALANWAARNRPAHVPARAARSSREYDYLIAGERFSHKQGKGATDTGVHWDALVAQGAARPWTSDTAMIYVSSGYATRRATWVGVTGEPTFIRHAWPPPDGGKRVLGLVHWAPEGTSEILALWPSVPTFSDVWAALRAEGVGSGRPANHFELLWVPPSVSVGSSGGLDSTGRAAVFLFEKSSLANLPVSKNNRATLLKKDTIRELMKQAQQQGTWCPLPLWPALFASNRPPDLYLAQRREFEEHNSPIHASPLVADAANP